LFKAESVPDEKGFSITIKFKRIRHIDIYTLKYNFIAPDKI